MIDTDIDYYLYLIDKKYVYYNINMDIYLHIFNYINKILNCINIYQMYFCYYCLCIHINIYRMKTLQVN